MTPDNIDERMRLKTLPILALLIATLLVTGCTQSSNEASVAVHPDAEEVTLPDTVNQNLKESLTENATVKAYTSQKSTEELDSWYRDTLKEEGWKNVEERGGITLWTHDDKGAGIATLSTQKFPPQQLGINASANSLIITLVDDTSAWQSFLTYVEGNATLGNDTVTFEATGVSPSPIPAADYGYRVLTLRNGNVTELANESSGVAAIEEERTITFPARGVDSGDVLMIVHNGSDYGFRIQTEGSPSNTMHR